MAPNGKKISRRDFIMRSTLGTIGAVGAFSALPGCSIVKDNALIVTNTFFGTQDPVPDGVTPVEAVKNNIQSTVSVVQNANAVHQSGKINPAVVQKMFDNAIYSYTGKKSIEEAWDELRPGLK